MKRLPYAALFWVLVGACSASEEANPGARCDEDTFCPGAQVCYRNFCIPGDDPRVAELDASASPSTNPGPAVNQVSGDQSWSYDGGARDGSTSYAASDSGKRDSGLATSDSSVATPSSPSLPSNPSVPEPTTPNTATDASAPATPTTPGTPAEPVAPTTPDVPTQPTTPEVPTDAGSPAAPSEPSNPGAPTEPNTPSEPSTPADAGMSMPTDAGAPMTPAEPQNPSAGGDVLNPAALLICLPSCANDFAGRCLECLFDVLADNPRVCSPWIRALDISQDLLCELLCNNADCGVWQ